VVGEVSATDEADGERELAWRQALATVSLDVDGTGYPQVARRDRVIGALQTEHAYLRPVLFHSPYEAACAFVIAHLFCIARGRTIRPRMATEHGAKLEVAGVPVHAFPAPQRPLRIDMVPGLTPEKVERLHGIARAALDGSLYRARLQELPTDEGLARMRALRGIGHFLADGIVLRGAGLVDAVPHDEITRGRGTASLR
jgi:DNA-3-methyladenine glycosylase II